MEAAGPGIQGSHLHREFEVNSDYMKDSLKKKNRKSRRKRQGEEKEGGKGKGFVFSVVVTGFVLRQGLAGFFMCVYIFIAIHVEKNECTHGCACLCIWRQRLIRFLSQSLLHLAIF